MEEEHYWHYDVTCHVNSSEINAVYFGCLALEVIQRIRGYFYNDMRYINLRFTYFTYLLTYQGPHYTG